MVSQTEPENSKDSEYPGAVVYNHVMDNEEIIMIDQAIASKAYDLGDTPSEVSEDPGAVDQFHVTDKICEVFSMINDLNRKIVSWCINVWILVSLVETQIKDKEFFKEIYAINAEVFCMSAVLLFPWALHCIINWCQPKFGLSFKEKLFYFIFYALSRYAMVMAFCFVCGFIWRVAIEFASFGGVDIDLEPQGGKRRVKLPIGEKLSGIEEVELREALEQEAEMNADISTAESEKSTRRINWMKRHDPRDSERFCRYVEEKKKKLLELKRAKGRHQGLKPEGAESAADEKFKEKVLHQMKSLSAAVPSDDYEVYVNLAMQGVAMLSLISTCTNSEEISKSIQGYLAGKLNVSVIKFFEKCLL
jgi:hypothetical protein